MPGLYTRPEEQSQLFTNSSVHFSSYNCFLTMFMTITNIFTPKQK